MKRHLLEHHETHTSKEESIPISNNNKSLVFIGTNTHERE